MTHTCPCGKPAVKKIADFYTCASCLEKDRVVTELHMQAVDVVDKKLTQQEAMEAMIACHDKRKRSYYRNKYWLEYEPA